LAFSHRFQHLALMGMVVLTATLTACSKKETNFFFDTPQEALKVCHTELSKVKPLKTANIDKLASITAIWLELQDSTLSCFMRDSTVKADTEIAADFFEVADSFRTEITRLALSEKRTMPEIVKLKVATASGRKENMKSKDYKTACDFYTAMDKVPLFQTLEQTLSEYEKLLTNADPFKKEGQLHNFIQKEDQCFRSLLVFLKDTPQSRLQHITDKTSSLFDALYRNTAADLDNEVNERVMMYLTMRFNRRIIQNAEVCRADIKKEVPLNEQQAANYRWMIIQPYMTIDNYAMALLTDDQIKTLTDMATELPRLLVYVDGKDYDKSPKEETEKLEGVLSEYFLKSYLKTIL
ncbi:MAG: hypothetical protein IJT97_03195, partial [Bacteroidaceae bacterium]|nr:hypothetical protein [Bacteroidaceae bacterium]